MLISLICDHGSSGIGAHSRNRSHIAGCMRVTPLSHAAHEDLEQCSRAAAAVWERPEAARAWRMESGEGDRPEGPGVRSGSTMGSMGHYVYFPVRARRCRACPAIARLRIDPRRILAKRAGKCWPDTRQRPTECPQARMATLLWQRAGRFIEISAVLVITADGVRPSDVSGVTGWCCVLRWSM